MSAHLLASTSLIASVLIHAAGLAVAAVLITPRAPSSAGDLVPIELVTGEEERQVALPPPPPTREIVKPRQEIVKPRPTETLTPPKLVSRPEELEVPTVASGPPESTPAAPPIAEPPPAPVIPPNVDAPRGNALAGNTEGNARMPVEGGGVRTESFSRGDLGVAQGSGGPGRRGQGLYASGGGQEVAGVPRDSDERATSFARPKGGYQTRPAYPETARRAGVEGVSVLRFEVLADGKVGGVMVERSAGHQDLDRAAIAAVRTWRFEPARRGADAVAVWVMLPVRFELRGR